LRFNFSTVTIVVVLALVFDSMTVMQAGAEEGETAASLRSSASAA
jgi:hypothetical protein